MNAHRSLTWEGGPLVGGGEIDLGVSEGEFAGVWVKSEIECYGAFCCGPVGHIGLEKFVEVIPGCAGEVELEVFWGWLER